MNLIFSHPIISGRSSFMNASLLSRLLVLSLGLSLTAAQAQQRGTGGGGFGGGGFGGFGGTSGSSSSSRSSSGGTTSRTYNSTGTIGDAYFSVDPETRRVVIIADEDTGKYVSEVIANLDKPKPQVLIKVVFLEVTYNNASDLGLEGGWSKNIGDSTSANAANVFGLGGLITTNGGAKNAVGQPISSFANSGAITSSGSGLYQILGQDYQVTLRAIAQAGKAKVLSRPSILARNNQPATITVGQWYPMITSVRYDNYGNAINSVSYQDVGVILKVTPFITSDGLVEMIVAPEISAVSSTTSVQISADVSAQAIDKRSAETVAVTPDGQTVIIGGLMQDTKARTDTKIPILGDIPLLGNLFKRQQKSDSKTELMIFLTPHIVQMPSQLAELSVQEKNKMNSGKHFTEEELNKYLETLPQDKAGNKSSKSGKGKDNF